MANQTNRLNTDMQKWLRVHASRPSAAMQELCQSTLQLDNSEMLTSREQLQFLAFLASSIQAKNAIEVGVYTGASALAIAEVLPENGTIVACDLTDEYLSIATPAWKNAGISSKIDMRVGIALDTLQDLLANGGENSFDFMYIDADKINSKNYYELGLQLIRSGGIIAIDNMFYGGLVADSSCDDPNAVATRDLASFLIDDDRVNYALIPIGDGLAIACVK